MVLDDRATNVENNESDFLHTATYYDKSALQSFLDFHSDRFDVPQFLEALLLPINKIIGS